MDKKTSDIPEEVQEVYGLLKKFNNDPKRSKWIDRNELGWDAIENEILTDKDKKELKTMDQEELPINYCVKGVQGSCAVVTDQKPEIKIHPVGSADLYVAELIKRGHDLVWERNEGNDETYDVVEEVNIGGLGFFEIHFDKDLGLMGRIIFEDTPPEDIYFDSESRKRNFSDTHLIKAKQRTYEYLHEKYPDLKDDEIRYKFDIGEKEVDEKSKGVTTGDQYSELGKEKSSPPEDEIQPKIYWEIEAWLLRTDPKPTDYVVEVAPGKEPVRYVQEIDDERKKTLNPGDVIETTKEGAQKIYWPKRLKKRVQRIIVGKALIEENDNPYGMDRDGNPLMLLIGLKGQRTRSAYPMSKTAYAVPLNRDAIKRRLQFNLVISQAASSPIVEPADAVDWVGTAGTAGSRAKVSKTAPFQPHRLEPGTIQANLFDRIEQKDREDINDQYDMHDVMRGKIPEGTDPSGRVVLALQDMGGMMLKPSLRALESALVRLAKVNIAMMLRHWHISQWRRLIEPDEWDNWLPEDEAEKRGDEELGEEERAEITAKWQRALGLVAHSSIEKRISLIDLDIKIVAGSSMPTNRIAKSMLAMEKLEAGMYDVEAALEYDDDPNKDRIIARMKEREKSGIMEALQAKK